MNKGRRYTIEDIKLSMKKEGYILLSDTYSSTKKLIYICNKGHYSSMLSCNWNKGRRCPMCKDSRIRNKLKLDFNVIKKSFKSENYILLSEESEYKNNRTKLEYICSLGHKHNMGWSHWQQGKRCPSCAKNSKIHYEGVKRSFEVEGYILFSKEYDYKTKLNYKCNLGHEHSMVWGHWQQGKKCPTCAIINKSGDGHPNWKGGISCEPYCHDWTKEYKDYIKERDNYMCLNPDCYGNNNPLSVHHINYNKKDCSQENLITICRSCNSRANKNRTWHESWYGAIMMRRGYI